MRIEFITSYFYPFTGGIENVVIHLAEGLSRRGHTVVVHTGNTYPGLQGKLAVREKHNKFLIKRYPIYPFSLFFPQLEFTDSVISLHNYSALMNDYVCRKYVKQKKVMTPYGTITYDRAQRKYPFFSTFYDSLLGRQTLSSLDTVVAMTEFEQKNIIKKYPQFRKKMVTIPSGVDIVSFNKNNSMKVPKNYFFSIGRIARSKNFENVLSVLAKFPSHHYLLAGSDNGYLKELKKIAQEKKVIEQFHYLGKVSDEEKAFLMENSDVFIMPSSAEAFSIASVEAFYYSKKVVGARSGGIIDVFRELGGSLYNSGDIQGLEKTLVKILETPVSSAVTEKRRKIIQSKYSWDKVIDDYEKTFSI